MKNLILIPLLALTLSSCNEESIIVKVKNSERITTMSEGVSSGYYLIFTDKGVFKNGDSFIVFKFNSSDIQNKIEAGNCYKINTRFWRIPFFSMYKNIMRLEELNCEKEHYRESSE